MPPLSPFNLTLVFPDLEVSDKTKRMYSRLTPANYSDGGTTRLLVQLLMGGHFVTESIRNYIYNVFQDIAEWEFPLLAQMRREVLEQGGPELYLCGAGPAMFAIPSSETQHRVVAEALQPKGAGVYLVTTTLKLTWVVVRGIQDLPSRGILLAEVATAPRLRRLLPIGKRDQ